MNSFKAVLLFAVIASSILLAPNGGAAEAVVEYRPEKTLLVLPSTFRTALDELRVGRTTDELWFLSNEKLIRFFNDTKHAGTLSANASVDLPPTLASLAKLPGGFMVLPFANGVWVAHRDTHQWWRFSTAAGAAGWDGPRPIPGRFWGAAALPDGKLVLNLPEQSSSFAVMSTDGKIIARFGDPLPAKLNVLRGQANSWLLASARNGDIIAAHAFRPIVRRYSSAGQLRWETRITGPQADRATAAEAVFEEGLRVDPETCCIEFKSPRLATALISLASGPVLVRIGLDLIFERIEADGSKGNPVLLRLEKGGETSKWIPSGIVEAGGSLVAAETGAVRSYAQARTTRPVEGFVHDKRGAGIGNAKIEIVENHGVLLTARTGGNGRFSLAGIEQSRTATLRVNAPGFSRALVSGVLREIASDITLEAAPDLCVTVRSKKNGHPLGSFAVEISIESASRGAVSRESDHAERFEDANGRGCLSSALPLPWIMRVSASGFATSSLEISDGHPVDIDLEDESRLEVKVTSSDNPVSGARLTIEPEGVGDRLVKVISSEAQGTTDEIGVAKLHGLTDGIYTLTVEHDDFLRWRQPVKLPLGDLPLEVRLSRGANLDVVILNKETQQPVPDAQVLIDPLGHIVPKRLECRTKADGHCTVSALPIGRFDIHASAKGFAEARKDLEIGPSVAQTSLTLALSTGVALRGRINGVELYPDTRLKLLLSTAGYPVVSTVVADNGEFSFDNVPPGKSSAWVLEARSENPLLFKTVEVKSASDYLTLDLPVPIVIFGAVTNNSRACSACKVTFELVGAEIGRALESTGTNGEGRYSLRIVSPGRYHVSLEEPLTHARASEVLYVNSDMQKDFELHGATIDVLVTSANSSSVVSGAEVQVLSSDGALELGSGETGANGHLAIQVPSNTDLRVTAVRSRSSGTKTVRTSSGVTPVRISLSDSEEIILTVADSATGLPLPAISARVTGSSGQTFFAPRVAPDENGVFHLPRFNSGPHRLVINLTGYAVKTVWATPGTDPQPIALIVGGRSFIVRADSNKSGICSIELRDSSGSSVALAPDAMPGPVPFSAREALFNLVEPGEYRLILNCGGQTSAQQVSLHPGSIPTVSF